jgi:hypothetical protein
VDPPYRAFCRGRDARRARRGLQLEAVAIILGRHHERTREKTAVLLALRAPILQQDEATGRDQRSRRMIADADPETGGDEPAAVSAGRALGARDFGATAERAGTPPIA